MGQSGCIHEDTFEHYDTLTDSYLTFCRQCGDLLSGGCEGVR